VSTRPWSAGVLTRRFFGGGRRGLWRRTVARRVVASLLAGAAAILSIAVARTPPDGPSVPVVVAARELAAGHRLSAADLQVVRIPSDLAPADPAAQPGRLLGQVLAGPVGTGEPVTARRLTGPGLLAGQQPGHVAAHVPVADPGSVAMVRPGDRIDLLGPDGAALASRVVVLAVDRSGAAEGRLDLGPAAAPPGVVVAVSPEAAAALAVATTAQGAHWSGPALTLVLRPTAPPS
jgi:pilus assembly protein CpaB